MIKSKEEAVGEEKLPKPFVTFNEADVKRQTAFADRMGLEAAKSSLLLNLLQLVSVMGRGWDLQISPAWQSLKKCQLSDFHHPSVLSSCCILCFFPHTGVLSCRGSGSAHLQ